MINKFLCIITIFIFVLIGMAGCHTQANDDKKSSNDEDGNFIEFDVTDCVDVENGEVWARLWDGSIHRIFGPEEHAVYSYIALPVLDPNTYKGAHFELRGQYANSRYISFHSQSEEPWYLIDLITGLEIEPDTGSVNPFREGEYPADGTPVNYTIKVMHTHPDDTPPGENIMFGGYPPDTGVIAEENDIVYRIYMPSDMDNPYPDRTGEVPFPRVYYVVDLDKANLQTPKTKADICQEFPNGLTFQGMPYSLYSTVRSFLKLRHSEVYLFQ